MIMAKVKNWEQKITIMRNKKSINIYIDNYLNSEEREMQMKARRLRREMSEKRKTEIKYEKGTPVVFVENVRYDWDNIEKDFWSKPKA